MIFTINRPYQEITKALKKDDVIALISCNNCVRVCATGGEAKMRQLAEQLRGDGYRVKEGFLLTKACPQPYMGTVRLNPAVNTLIVMACYAGYSNAKRRFPDRKLVQTTEDCGLLITDSDRGAVQVAVAFEGHEDAVGKQFEIGSGKPL